MTFSVSAILAFKSTKIILLRWGEWYSCYIDPAGYQNCNTCRTRIADTHHVWVPALKIVPESKSLAPALQENRVNKPIHDGARLRQSFALHERMAMKLLSKGTEEIH